MSVAAVWESVVSARVPRASWLVTLDGALLASSGEDRRYASASMIKTFLAVALAELRPDWSARVVVSPEHVAPSDGIARSLSLPVELPLRDVVTLAIALSDNTASNTLVAACGGLDHVNAVLERQGFSARMLRWLSGVGPDASCAPAFEMPGTGVCSAAEHDRAVSLALLNADLRHALLAQADRRSLARWLPEEVAFAHKTGTDARVSHDGGVLVGPDGRSLAVTCFTDGGPEAEHVDHPACLAMGEAMALTLHALGWSELLVEGAPAPAR